MGISAGIKTYCSSYNGVTLTCQLRKASLQAMLRQVYMYVCNRYYASMIHPQESCLQVRYSWNGLLCGIALHGLSITSTVVLTRADASIVL